MAIRLRRSDGILIALCAARSVPRPGDLYLDDEAHMALARKFWLDYPQLGIECDPGVKGLIEREESNNPNRATWDALFAGSTTP
jgi:hypothetical protein